MMVVWRSIAGSVAAFALTAVLCGCSKSTDGMLNHLNNTFQLAWPKGIVTSEAMEWEYRSAFEGWQATKVTLAKVTLEREQLETFASLNSNRVTVVKMDDHPPDLSKYSERCSWWDLARFDTYEYFTMESRSPKYNGNLQGFITRSGTNGFVFLVGHTSNR
jgi:hypothetical protein